jgi:hypothetical protein
MLYVRYFFAASFETTLIHSQCATSSLSAHSSHPTSLAISMSLVSPPSRAPLCPSQAFSRLSASFPRCPRRTDNRRQRILQSITSRRRQMSNISLNPNTIPPHRTATHSCNSLKKSARTFPGKTCPGTPAIASPAQLSTSPAGAYNTTALTISLTWSQLSSG